ncbi:MAG: peptidoglycan D,D-transpeptidase FtsI family protein [Christensenellales bacterium]|jgi:peptidoglycan glycosyltransferase
MKKNVLKKNIRTLLIVFIVMFALLIVYLGYVNVVYGERWFATAYNPRIQNMKTNVQVGNILDRTGLPLLFVDNGEREYIEDKGMRIAIAHVVGDEYGLSYGAQTMYAKYLFGFDKDTITRIVDLLSGEERTGSDVTLTIDALLCKTAMDAMNGNDGAVVVMNYQTGEILASISSPSFDPEDMSLFLEGGGDSELVNRASSGLYPPGSTFKLITAAALIDNGMADFKTTCKGSIMIGGKEIACTSKHGDVGLHDAIEHSCNVYFAEAAVALGTGALKAKADKFLFNTNFLFSDVVMENSIFKAAANDLDAAWSSIGQYHDLITPLHACMIAACIANDGVMMEPKLLKSVSNNTSETYAFKPKTAATPMDNTDSFKEMMVAVVKSGTGTKAAIDGYTVAGKTGTAEIATKDGKAAHAWFVGFINDDDHPLAIAVILEKAGSGGANAAPVAKKVLKKAINLGY